MTNYLSGAKSTTLNSMYKDQLKTESLYKNEKLQIIEETRKWNRKDPEKIPKRSYVTKIPSSSFR